MLEPVAIVDTLTAKMGPCSVNIPRQSVGPATQLEVANGDFKFSHRRLSLVTRGGPHPVLS